MIQPRTVLSVFLLTALPCNAMVLINELDADQSGTDTAEFVELYNAGSTPVDLAAGGYVLVLYNGATLTSYRAAGLTGTIPAGGHYVVGAATVPNVSLTPASWPATNIVQNGPDAVALYRNASAAAFPNGTAATSANLVDAVVYDTSDADVPGLMDVLTPGQPQIDENANGKATTESIQRIPDGAGGPRVTTAYGATDPTPGRANPSNDNTGPVVQLAYAWGADEVRLLFDEPLDPTTAQTAANYTLYQENNALGAPATATVETEGSLASRVVALVFPNGRLTGRTVFSLRIRHVRDRWNNPILLETESNRFCAGIQSLAWAGEQVDDMLIRDRTACITVQGTVTSNTQLGPAEIYLQDGTGGILHRDSRIEASIDTLEQNDVLRVAGFPSQVRGQAQLDRGPAGSSFEPVTQEIIDEGGDILPRTVSIASLGETTENLLVRLPNTTIAGGADHTFIAERTYQISDDTGTGQLYVDGESDLVGTAIPAGPLSLLGLVGQEANLSRDSQPVPFSGYRLVPRTADDIGGPRCESDTDNDGVCDDREAPFLTIGPGQSNRTLADSDGDGLRDGDEDTNGSGDRSDTETSTRDADSDGDRYEDGIERLLGSDPLRSADPAAVWADTDGDGLPNAQDPNSTTRDSDGDRIDDGYEAAHFRNLTAVLLASHKPPLADGNGDGFLTSLDALIVQSFFLQIINAESAVFQGPVYKRAFRYMDTNRDGFLTSLDALIIQSFFLQIQPSLPLR